MTIPGWYPLLLLSLASYRTYRLLGTDTILDGPRSRLNERWLAFVECPWCLGFWVSLGWWIAYEGDARWTLIVATPLAIAAVAALVWAIPI